ncbi:ABC transporter permease [Cylindrospermum sp. FACHB-282]|uniref:ABC transporter permease n=1 Tax=Cylindrospermum sp. FACHB-282 TaxID=2692794 RepID=UPI001683CCA0|nr:ABC transporter permease [Cylindrospermum sp. FACHB-282]MBD2385508.1 ABC transporter permease [Cylindrospermum sp. FACHB-282]
MKYYRETIAVTKRILIELLRRRRSLIFWSIFPISILIINGFILAEGAKLSMAVAFENAAPSTLVGAALFFSCLGGSVATVVAEREQQTLKRLFISPLSGLSYFLGIFLAHSCIGIGQTLLVYTVAAFWGATFKGSIFLGITIIFLSIIAYVGLGFIFGTQLARRTEDVNALIAAFGVPLLILGGAFLPTSLFPPTLLEIAKYNPIYHMNEALLAVSARGEEISKITSRFVFLLVFAMVMVVGGWLSYRRMLMVEKRL